MMNHFINKLQELLKEIWKDFKNPVSLTTGTSHCCSSTAYIPEDDLHPARIKEIQQNSIKNNPQNNQS